MDYNGDVDEHSSLLSLSLLLLVEVVVIVVVLTVLNAFNNKL